jgi:hypothetical protein
VSPDASEKKYLSYDKLLKAFLKRYYRELGEWLLGERPESAEEDETTQAMVQERVSDRFIRLRFKEKPGVLLHLELQLKGDLTMPRRITEYAGFSLTVLERALREGLLPACIVLYLDRETYREDPGWFDLVGALGFRLYASYRVVKLWELPPEPILEMESPGLCPFLPLMAGKPEALLVRSVEKIRAAPKELASAEEKRDLLLALRAMAKRVIKDMSLIEAMLSDPELLEGDPFYMKGQEKALREDVLDVLAARFGDVPEDIGSRLATIRAREDLKRLLVAAARAADLETFRASLPAH